ncbi:hypothetical protein WICPIJ_000986 [Wickerhamomyces pijperi]|uniref:Uncharacterized protein n=1 Tax=Wickerhamomyces pijperi TaxID=599730 RepID=A0A9P8QBL0_WICPI|nr:hypothetical protein WICPIJ_000986 [Wickerhamomyces pijperi]
MPILLASSLTNTAATSSTFTTSPLPFISLIVVCVLPGNPHKANPVCFSNSGIELLTLMLTPWEVTPLETCRPKEEILTSSVIQTPVFEVLMPFTSNFANVEMIADSNCETKHLTVKLEKSFKSKIGYTTNWPGL